MPASYPVSYQLLHWSPSLTRTEDYYSAYPWAIRVTRRHGEEGSHHGLQVDSIAHKRLVTLHPVQIVHLRHCHSMVRCHRTKACRNGGIRVNIFRHDSQAHSGGRRMATECTCNAKQQLRKATREVGASGAVDAVSVQDGGNRLYCRRNSPKTMKRRAKQAKQL